MANNDEKVTCRTPTPGKTSTRIPAWKYGLVRSAILSVVPASREGIEFKNLSELVEKEITEVDLENLGSVSWYTTTVKLDMEVKGELERIPGSKPQRLRRIADSN